MILGILAAVAVPRYQKTIETARAREAQTLLRLVYNANRMYVINNCPTASNCYRVGEAGSDADATCTDSTGGDLVTGNYVQNLNDPDRPFVYCAADLAASPTYVARARRRSGTYNTWVYTIDASGAMTALNSAPDVIQ